MGSRLLLSSLMLGLAACAGPVETRVNSAGPGIASSTTIFQEALPTSSTAAQARAAVITLLTEKGYRETQAGDVQLHVAFAERDAAISVKTKSGDTVADIAAAKAHKPLQSCADREMRLAVTLTRITDGIELYRGTASEYHCKAQMVEVLPALVTAALADLSQPKGAYKITRQGLE
ncbi:hypothetical protein [Sphingorhabdus sp.]|uniref:hypothetical protein n=1 Tax=Sphingorhabdus sp. TaxID=1902408 RepID=UPI0032B7EFB2